MMNSKLSSNVIEEIYKYADKKLKEDAPKFIVKVKKIERDNRRYCAVLLDGSNKEILAIFSPLLTEKIPIQDLIVDPVIKINHYYLYKFKAEDFSIHPPGTDIDVMGVSDIQILHSKELKKIKMENNTGNVNKSRKLERSRKETELLMALLEKESKSQVNNTEEVKNIVEQVKTEDPPKKQEPKPQIHRIEPVKHHVKPLEVKNQKQDQGPRSRAELTKIKTDIKPQENINQQQNQKSPNEMKNKVEVANCSKPLENKQQIMVNTAFSPPDSFAGNRRLATNISSLVTAKYSPLIRGILSYVGEKRIGVTAVYTWCRIQDHSGNIYCLIFEPVCSRIYPFLKTGAMIETQNGRVDAEKIPGQYKLVINSNADISIYHNIKCVYRFLANITPSSASSSSSSNNVLSNRYPRILNIKQFLHTNERVDAIGVLTYKSELIKTQNSDNTFVKYKNLIIKDESGSATVMLRNNTAEQFNSFIGSILVVKAACPKMVQNDLQLIVDEKSKVSIADNSAEKTRIERWYQRSKITQSNNPLP